MSEYIWAPGQGDVVVSTSTAVNYPVAFMLTAVLIVAVLAVAYPAYWYWTHTPKQ